MQYTYPQQYIFIPPDLISGFASGVFIIGSVALFVMLRKIILNFYLRKEKLLALSNFLYAVGILAFIGDAIFYIWHKSFLDEYTLLSILSVIIGVIIVLGVPKFRLAMFVFSAVILALIPIEISPISYTVQSRTYTVVVKYIPLELFVTGLIIFLSVMFILTRVYGPISLAISLATYSVLLYLITSGIFIHPLINMILHLLSFAFFISSGLFGSEKTIISGLDKTLVAFLVSAGIGTILYTVQISIPLAITTGGVILFGGVAAYFSTIFESKHYKFRDTPSLLLSLGDLSFSFVSTQLIPYILYVYGLTDFYFASQTFYIVLIFEVILLTVMLFAVASLIIIKQQKYLPVLTFLAGISAAVTVVDPFTFRIVFVVIDVIIFLIPTLIFLRFGYRLHKMQSAGASVTLSTGVVLLLYIISYGVVLQFGALPLVGAILFLFAAILTTFISMYGIIIIPASRSVNKK